MSRRDGAGVAETATAIQPALRPRSVRSAVGASVAPALRPAMAEAPAEPVEAMALSGLGALFDPASGAGNPPLAALVDVWGVLTDGARAFVPAIEALKVLRARGVPVALVSNTSRRGGELARLLEGQGLASDLHDAVITGGGLAFGHLSAEVARRRAGGGDDLRCLIVGTQPGGDWARDAGLRCVASVDEADLLLGFGVLGQGDPRPGAPPPAPDIAVRRLLRTAARSGLPLILTNADTSVRIAGALHLGIGALAPLYQSLGGTVRIYGKPGADMFAAALDAVGVADPGRVVMIGDTLATDIAGARDVGIVTVLVTGAGSHADELHVGAGGTFCAEALARLARRARVMPHHVMEAMQW
ncbi:TIGR01459 family HAD-type hydrolase [Stappia sp.]|uniref:TIGR01459 family HAD-type hydrolase n=1 Tax=Stappia sp. TaxID=1870903 RepID=UPI003C7D6323